MIGFWIFMLVNNLLIPLTTIIFGHRFIIKPPKEINYLYGYRTSMSMKNTETWKYAHNFCGKLWCIFGWIMLPLSIVVMFFVIDDDVNWVGYFGLFICLIQLVVMIIPIIFTEIALNKKFDKNGDRRFL